MRILRQMGGGLVIAVVSLLLVVGGIFLSLTENSPNVQATPTLLPPLLATSIEVPTLTPVTINTVEVPTTVPPSETPVPSATQAAPTVCTPPSGWIAIVVTTNETLYTIAEKYKTTSDILDASNCLNNTIPAAGSILYVPPVPTVTVIPCGPYSVWIKGYYVKPGDNLYRISLLYRTTVAQLQRANCMGNSTTIYVNQLLWVPNVPTSTPGVTIVPTFLFDTATPSTTPSPTSTFITTSSPVPPTATASIAPTDTSVPADTSTPSLTPLPSATNTTSTSP